jgi:transaldolase
MKTNHLKQLGTLGQSIWLDYIRRDLIAGGGLRRLIEEDGLRGMTSNPSIFEKAIADSHDYDEDIRAMALAGKGVEAIYETLSQRDVQSAADELRSLYERTDGKDGYVSLEVNPHLAHDTNIYAESFRGPDHLRHILEEAQTIVSDALAASPQQPGIPPKRNMKDKP